MLASNCDVQAVLHSCFFDTFVNLGCVWPLESFCYTAKVERRSQQCLVHDDHHLEGELNWNLEKVSAALRT